MTLNGLPGLFAALFTDFLRHRLMVFLVLLFPLILILMAVISAPDGTLPLPVDDGTTVASAQDINVLLFASTSVVLVASLTGFFTGFQLRRVVPRLRTCGYSSGAITAAVVLFLLAVALYSTLFTGSLMRFWVTPERSVGTYLALFAGAAVFSILGLIIARLADSKALGLNIILAVAVLDTSFLENPVFSRRYSDGWLDIMPAHRPTRALMEAALAGGSPWGHLGWSLVYAGIVFAVAVAVPLLWSWLRRTGRRPSAGRA